MTASAPKREVIQQARHTIETRLLLREPGRSGDRIISAVGVQVVFVCPSPGDLFTYTIMSHDGGSEKLGKANSVVQS